jgi:hypothetical protein|tara:strand:+ start:10316 stop:10747 length:432 start_codon:yes stop_codon:yes gene_type:complete
MNPIEVPNDFINKVMESNGLVNETVNESDATPLNEEAEVTSNETTLNEATSEEVPMSELVSFLKEQYNLEVNEDVAGTLVEFAEDFSSIFKERLDEAEAQGEEEIDIDLDVITEVLSENYEMNVDNVDVVASLVEFAYDYMQA